jgi:hypothetical protein
MKKYILFIGLISLLLISACTPATVAPDVECLYNSDCDENEICQSNECVEEEPIEVVTTPDLEDEIVEEEEVIEVMDESVDGLYTLTVGETKTILGAEIYFDNILNLANEVRLFVDGESVKILETKKEEIASDLEISVNVFDFKDDMVTFKIIPLELEENQFLVRKGTPLEYDGKEIAITDSKSTDHIVIKVNTAGESDDISDIIYKGRSETVNGIKIKNVKNYYINTNYAIIEIL